MSSETRWRGGGASKDGGAGAPPRPNRRGRPPPLPQGAGAARRVPPVAPTPTHPHPHPPAWPEQRRGIPPAVGEALEPRPGPGPPRDPQHLATVERARRVRPRQAGPGPRSRSLQRPSWTSRPESSKGAEPERPDPELTDPGGRRTTSSSARTSPAGTTRSTQTWSSVPSSTAPRPNADGPDRRRAATRALVDIRGTLRGCPAPAQAGSRAARPPNDRPRVPTAASWAPGRIPRPVLEAPRRPG